MKKRNIAIFFIVIIALALTFQILRSSEPSTTSTNTEKTILDFSELERFNSTEETEDYRFEMRVGEAYRLQDCEYHYLGDGKMLIKDFSDPEFVKEYRWLLQIGNKPTIGTKRSYSVTVIEVRSAAIVFRIETMRDNEE